MRKIHGTSYVVAAAIMIVVAIALAVVLYFASQRFTGVGSWAQVQSYQIQNKFTATSQIATVGIRIMPKTNSPLYLKGIIARVTPSSGAPALISYAIPATPATSALPLPTSTVIGGGIASSVIYDGANVIMPGQTVEISVTFVASATNPIGSVSFTVILADPTGTTQSFTTNEVSLT